MVPSQGRWFATAASGAYDPYCRIAVMKADHSRYVTPFYKCGGALVLSAIRKPSGTAPRGAPATETAVLTYSGLSKRSRPEAGGGLGVRSLRLTPRATRRSYAIARSWSFSLVSASERILKDSKWKVFG